jgi:hypothetical protein
MFTRKNLIILVCFFTFLVYGCAKTQPKIQIDTGSSQPGGEVNFKGKPIKLLGHSSLGKTSAIFDW